MVPHLDLVVIATAGDEEGLGFVEVDASDSALVLVEVVGQSSDAVVAQLDDSTVGACKDPWVLRVEDKALYPFALGFEFGYKATGSICDIVSPLEREKLIATVSSEFNGKLNILVNKVGTNIDKQVLDFTEEDLKFLFNTNVESAYHIYQLAHPLLKASEAGNIIFISSIAGVVPLNVGSVPL
ncbi:hypothetical protein RJT34_16208 [Clitoria ternatea]|uniref:Uncharacterized protein n=1 Tax=Clitoria ternatea TaxID=43366 RepID=A0AAN9PC31_CLITE